MHAIHFVTDLKIVYKDAVEKVLFFNANQHRLKSKVESSLESYGVPSIQSIGDNLVLVFNKTIEYPVLYVLDSDSIYAELLGMIIYKLEGDKSQIIHIAINEFCILKIEENELILFRLMEKFRREMLSKNIGFIGLPYSKKKIATHIKFMNVWV